MLCDKAEPASRTAPIVAAAIAVRLAYLTFLALLPHDVASNDMGHWIAVASILRRGENPYAVSGYLNWPPLWMQLIALFDAIARRTAVPLTYVIRLFLISVDCLNVGLALRLASNLASPQTARRPILWGLALNPVAILLVCQHGNFDVLVAAALLAAMLALTRYRRTADATDWLASAFAIGIGALIKTVPLLLAPLLISGSARLTRSARVLGALLLVTPIALGTSIIYVLAPESVTTNVLRYRSYSGWFGITGLLELANLDAAVTIYTDAFPAVAILAIVLIARRLRRTDLSPHALVLLAATMLLAVITFGPGYGTQYIAWVMPLFAAAYASFDEHWRRDLITVFIVAIATYLVEYAFIADLGQLLIVVHPSTLFRRIGDVLNEDRVRTLLRLPLFGAYAWLVLVSAARLRRAPTQ